MRLTEANKDRTLSAPGIHGVCVPMRAHPEDFRRLSLEGEITGADVCDWPLTFDELEPYYEEVEEALQIAGPTHYPWGKRRRRYPQREHELNASAEVFVRGCTKRGIPVAPAPIATLSAPYWDRPPCVYRGFCNYGCTTNAKSSILVTYVPRAIAAGAGVRADSMVARISTDARRRVTGVLLFAKGAVSFSGRARGT
ncbi:MAG: GMC family oxidoreductase N-terminal domain-containing protein [Pyrinomonadaceae bacterium]